MNASKSVVRTAMALAMVNGLHSCIAAGRNPGRIGRHIITADTRGVGVQRSIKRNPKFDAK